MFPKSFIDIFRDILQPGYSSAEIRMRSFDKIMEREPPASLNDDIHPAVIIPLHHFFHCGGAADRADILFVDQDHAEHSIICNAFADEGTVPLFEDVQMQL